MELDMNKQICKCEFCIGEYLPYYALNGDRISSKHAEESEKMLSKSKEP